MLSSRPVSFSLRQFVKAISISFSVAALTAITVYIVSYLALPVTGVRIEGVHKFPKSEIRQDVPNRASLITLNSGLLERRVESNPWVQSAGVSKNWRSGIVTVKVEERRAVLEARINGKKVFLASDGTRLRGSGGADLHRVSLDKSQLEEIVENAKLLKNEGLTLDAVESVNAGGVKAMVDGREVVFSGKIEAGQARALKSIMRKNPGADKVFDLRSPQRVVVGNAGSGTSGA